jgi:hypothetical protein
MLASGQPTMSLRLLPALAVAIAIAVVSAVACDKKQTDPGSTAAAKATSSEAITAVAHPPRTTPVDGAAIMGAARLAIEPFTPWAEAETTLLAALGRPTRIDGDKHYWAVVEGDTCTYTFVEKQDRSAYFKGEAPGQLMVGTTMKPTEIKRQNGSMNWDECVAATGAPPAAPAAPAAAAPTLDLTRPVPLSDLVAGFKADKTGLLGKKVQLAGLYLNDTVAEAGGKKQMTLSLVAERGKMDPSVVCMLPRPVEHGLKQYAEVVVEGTVGEFFDGPSLDECAVVSPATAAK